MNESDDTQQPLILDWSFLSTEEADDRLVWLRASLRPGIDWGYCREVATCVILNQEASMLYRLRWFEADKQSYVDRPRLLNINNSLNREEEKNDVW